MANLIVYKEGLNLEDGFECGYVDMENEYHTKGECKSSCGNNQAKYCHYKNSYIITPQGKKYLRDGDYINIGRSGNKSVTFIAV